jgi:hypothetical protein
MAMFGNLGKKVIAPAVQRAVAQKSMMSPPARTVLPATPTVPVPAAPIKQLAPVTRADPVMPKPKVDQPVTPPGPVDEAGFWAEAKKRKDSLSNQPTPPIPAPPVKQTFEEAPVKRTFEQAPVRYVSGAPQMKKGGPTQKYTSGGKINLGACSVSTHSKSKKSPNW